MFACVRNIVQTRLFALNFATKLEFTLKWRCEYERNTIIWKEYACDDVRTANRYTSVRATCAPYIFNSCSLIKRKQNIWFRCGYTSLREHSQQLMIQAIYFSLLKIRYLSIRHLRNWYLIIFAVDFVLVLVLRPWLSTVGKTAYSLFVYMQSHEITWDFTALRQIV